MSNPLTRNILSNAGPESYGIAHLLNTNEAPDDAQAYIVDKLVLELLRVLHDPQASSIPTSRGSSLKAKNSTLNATRSIFLPAYPNLRHRADVSLHLRKKVHAYKSILHPIRRVPIFLWSYIFQMMIDDEDADQIDMVGYSHVCSKWRTSIIGTLEIWTQVKVRVDRDVEEIWEVDGEVQDEGSEGLEHGTLVEIRAGETLRDFTHTITRRSGNLPMDISLHYEDEREMWAAKLVFESFVERERWRSLNTGVVGFSEIFGDAGETWDRLEEVVVSQKGDDLLGHEMFGEFSMLTAYRLRRLTMQWNGILPDCTRYLLPWSQLHELHLDIAYCTISEHISIVSNCASLQILSIALTTSQVASPCDPHFLDTLQGRRVTHPRIHTFTFTARHMTHPTLLKYLALPALVDLTVKFEYAPRGWFFMPRGSRDKRGGRLHEVIGFLEASRSDKRLKGFEFWTKFNMPWRDLLALFGAMPAVVELSLRVGNDGNYVSNGESDMGEDKMGVIKRAIKEEDEGERVEEDQSTGLAFFATDMEDAQTPTNSDTDSGFEDTTIPRYKTSKRLHVMEDIKIPARPPLPSLSKLHIHGKFLQLPMILLLKFVGYDHISIDEPVFEDWYEDVVTLDFDVVTKRLEVVSANMLTREMVKECLDIAEKRGFSH